MIIGIGVDIVEIDRFRSLTERWGERLLNRIFTQQEIDYCLSKRNPYQHLAGKFAAKEAISKAIATGWSGIFRWKDVEVLNDESGKPIVIIHNQLREHFKSCLFYVSISHSLNYAVSFAVIERN